MAVIEYEVRDRIAYVTLNRPETLNAINNEMSLAWNEVWERFRDDDDAWAAILTGAGDRAFCSGADLKEMRTRHDSGANGGNPFGGDPRPMRPSEELGVWKPIIAAINGWAIGGGVVFAMDCDIRIASEKSGIRSAGGGAGDSYYLVGHREGQGPHVVWQGPGVPAHRQSCHGSTGPSSGGS